MTIILGDARAIDRAQFQQYSTIIADPPWWYADQRKVRKDGKTPTRGIGACHHYGQMTTDEICQIPVANLTAERCHLFLWATCPLLPDALRVMDAWRFEYSTIAFVWVKLNPGIIRQKVAKLAQLLIAMHWHKFLDKLTFYGPGFYTGSNVELVLLGNKRKAKPFPHDGYKASQIIYAPRGDHSQKPDIVQEKIARMYPQATPRLELFARRPIEGWDVFGNDIQERDNLLL